jgi:hypothetical protein
VKKEGSLKALAVRFGLLLFLAACSDAGLEPVQLEESEVFDDKLELKGRVCTDPPANELFPVKIMFIVDTSYSEQVTDPTQQRVEAVLQVIDRYAGNPSVKFSVVAFDSVVTDVTNGFVSSPDVGELRNRLDDSDRLTDYQGALGTAYAILTRDMIESSPAERARSKYVVIFFSDGNPDPQCTVGGMAPPEPPVCKIPREEWPDQFELPPGNKPDGTPWTWEDFMGLYPDMAAGADYNTTGQLVASVEDILSLQEIYNVNEIRFHTGFLFDPNLPQAFVQAFQLDRREGIDLMTRMAQAGNGTFTEFTSGAAINFLNINYASTKKVYEMTGFLVRNGSSVATVSGPVPDSDGDGLPDELEDELRLCSYEGGGVNCNPGSGRLADPSDTDGDGYTDFFEHRFRSSGFDPKIGAVLTEPCDERDDSDGDGLLDCEEVFIGSDARGVDSDADRIPDGIEIRFGLNPLEKDDALFDTDSDGVRNVDEILRHWSPIEREPASALPPKVEYTITYEGEQLDGTNCYTFDVKNVKLHTTRASNAERRGKNRIWLDFLEGPRNDPRDFGKAHHACVDVRYVAPDLKDPPDGRIELTAKDFFEPTDPAIECVTPDRDEEMKMP